MLSNDQLLSNDQCRFLDSRRVGHLATADKRGAPHVVPVCFAISDNTAYITIDQKPKGNPRALKRLRNITENPSVALVGDRYDEDWSRLGWVMLRGRAEILDSGAEHGMAQELLRARYPQYQAMQLMDLPVIAIRIAQVASWGDLSAVP
ncbi:MAG: TIGR03668 family PPOX class F420-dependent oxidoreductase [Alphaproteobacteria bacterium]|nr:TIGR03668 family PPOX class F420-dependent oxidoreductase [Alphaproteobacteria bacterium]